MEDQGNPAAPGILRLRYVVLHHRKRRVASHRGGCPNLPPIARGNRLGWCAVLHASVPGRSKARERASTIVATALDDLLRQAIRSSHRIREARDSIPHVG